MCHLIKILDDGQSTNLEICTRQWHVGTATFLILIFSFDNWKDFVGFSVFKCVKRETIEQ